MLAQIKTPYFTAGLVLVEDVVTEAAPILKFMIGWGRAGVRGYCRGHGWEVKIVQQQPQS